jgi:hypothetical protein
VDGGDGLQIWRVAANILNKQSQTANKGWSCGLGGGPGDNKNSATCYEMLHTILDLDGFTGRTYAMENGLLSSHLLYRKLKLKIYKTITVSVICTSMKLGLIHYRRVFECCGEYLDLGEREWQGRLHNEFHNL